MTTTRLAPHLLDLNNLALAMTIAKEAFPSEKDYAYLKESLFRAAKQQGVYLSPGLNRQIRQLPHFIYYLFELPIGFGGVAQYEEEPKVSWISWLGMVSDSWWVWH